MPMSHDDLLSHLVELFDYRVGEVSYVDEGASLLPFLITKNLKRDAVKKEAFDLLLQTEVKNSGKVIEVLKNAKVPEGERAAVENVLKVLTGLKTTKSLSNKTLGDALVAAELADMTGTASKQQNDIRSAFDFIADRVAGRVNKGYEGHKEDEEEKKPEHTDKAMGDGEGETGKPPEEEKPSQETPKEEMDFEADKAGNPFAKKDEEDEEDEEGEVEKAASGDDTDGGGDPATEAEEVNKNLGNGGSAMDLSKLPITEKGDLDVIALKRAKMEPGVISVVKGLWDQNQGLTKTMSSLNERLSNEVELRVDKHYVAEASEFENIEFEGLKDVLKKFGTTCPDEYVKLKSLLKVANDNLKPAAQQDFSPMGGSRGGSTPSEPALFYEVCKRKAVEQFKDQTPVAALQLYWKTPEGHKDYGTYDRMVTNKS